MLAAWYFAQCSGVWDNDRANLTAGYMWLWISNTFRKAGWAPLTVFVCYVVLASATDTYVLHHWLELPTHFCGGLAITYFYLAASAQVQPLTGAIPRPVRLMLALGLTAITAIVWELLEYFSDMLLHTRLNVDVPDIVSDLFFGLLGGGVMIAAAAFSPRLACDAAGRATN